MRILIDATNIAPQVTGAGVYARRVLSLMEDVFEAHDCTVLLRKSIPEDDTIWNLPVTFKQVGYGPIGVKRDVQLSWYMLWHRRAFDVYFNFMPYLPLLFSHRESIVTIHDTGHLKHPFFPTPFHTWYFRLVTNRSFRKARHIVTVSETSREAITTIAAYRGQPITVAYCDSSLDLPLTYDMEPLLDAPYMLCVAEKRPHKNLFRLLEAFAQIHPTYGSYKLVLVGKDYDGAIDALRKHAIALGIEDAVVLRESVSVPELLSYYQHATVLALVSLYEGFGIPILEAMRSGIPVVTSNCSSMREVAGEAAQLIDPTDVESIASGLQVVLGDAEYRTALIERGRNRAKDFSWEHTANQIMELLTAAKTEM